MNVSMRNVPLLAGVCMVVLLLCQPVPAWAYMGPGLGLGAIGSVLGMVGAVFLAIVAVVWYPFKRLIRRMRGQPSTGAVRTNVTSKTDVTGAASPRED